MQADLDSRLAALRPAIKARWAALLRVEPAAPPPLAAFVRPDMLALLHNNTLDRLSAGFAQPATPGGSVQNAESLAALHKTCQCGLHLLLTYYLTGTRALEDTLPADLGPDRAEVLQQFNRLANGELAALCGGCRYRGGAQCHLPPRLASPDWPG